MALGRFQKDPFLDLPLEYVPHTTESGALKVLHYRLRHRYTILRAGPTGSNATIGIAFDHQQDCEVVIKFLRSGASDYERKIIDYLKSKDPGQRYPFPQLVDYFKFGQHPCIVMPYLGTPLDAYQWEGKITVKGTTLSFLSQKYSGRC
jgi:hypothetical protein